MGNLKNIILKTIFLLISIKLFSQTPGVTFDPNSGQTVTTNYGSIFTGVNQYGWGQIKSDRNAIFVEKPLSLNNGVIGSYNTSNLIFQTNVNPSTSPLYNVTRMTILYSNGNVGINTTTPLFRLDINGDIHSNSNAYFDGNIYSNFLFIGTQKPNSSGPHADAKLSVDGKILAKSIYVSINSSTWADYVFSKDYKLLPLNEVEKYYKKEKHLPGIPSAFDMEKNSINIAEMNAKLLEKIEELTIYIVELEKRVINIEAKLSEIK